MFSFIMMSCGHVESNSTSWLMYGIQGIDRGGFETMEEGIKELALDLYAKFYDDHLSIYEKRYGRDVDKCCRDNMKVVCEDGTKHTPGTVYTCPTCGKDKKDEAFDPEEFRQYICSLHGSTCDDYGDVEYTRTRNHLSWWPYPTVKQFRDAPKDSVIWIGENAEHVLLSALYDAKPELKQLSDYQDYSEEDWEKLKEGKQPWV